MAKRRKPNVIRKKPAAKPKAEKKPRESRIPISKTKRTLKKSPPKPKASPRPKKKTAVRFKPKPQTPRSKESYWSAAQRKARKRKKGPATPKAKAKAKGKPQPPLKDAYWSAGQKKARKKYLALEKIPAGELKRNAENLDFYLGHTKQDMSFSPNYSSLRHLDIADHLRDRLRDAQGMWSEFEEEARDIADEFNVSVGEVYTLFYSP